MEVFDDAVPVAGRKAEQLHLDLAGRRRLGERGGRETRGAGGTGKAEEHAAARQFRHRSLLLVISLA